LTMFLASYSTTKNNWIVVIKANLKFPKILIVEVDD
jgi:hypothetical protein